MKTFLSNLKFWFLAAIGLAMGVLAFLLERRTEQRDEQAERADRAERNQAAVEEQRDEEREIVEARAMAEDQNEWEGVKREESFDADGMPSGRIGDHSRMRK